jgi:uncharacterized RDD family membrane protein YckC
MDMQTNPSKKPTLPEDFFEDFDFRPVTEGLGFHHAKKNEEAIQMARALVAEKSSASRSAPRSEHPFTNLQTPLGPPAQAYVQSDLSLFYNQTVATAPQDTAEPTQVRLAPRAVRAVAFVMDLMVLLVMMWMTFGAVEVFTELPLLGSLVTGQTDMLLSATMLFSGYFVIYFTILEKFQGASLGKELLGLRIVDGHLNPISLVRAASRSVVTLVGFLSLGFTAWMDLTGKVTDTQVVRV